MGLWRNSLALLDGVRCTRLGRLPLPINTTHSKQKHFSLFWGYGGIGRRAGFRFQSARVQVQLLLAPPKKRKKMKSEVVFLVGPPGCGKSTYAKQNFDKENFVVLSSDEIRQELLKDESDQSQNDHVFEVLYKRMNDALSKNKNVVIDATNITKKTRKFVFDNIKFECTKTALVFDTPKNVCHILNKRRERVVPDYVIEKYFNIFEFPEKSEGFNNIKKIHINVN